MVFRRGWLTVPVMLTTPGMLAPSLRWDVALAVVVPPRRRIGGRRGGIAEPGREPLLGRHGGSAGDHGRRRWVHPGPRPCLLVQTGVAPVRHFVAFFWAAFGIVGAAAWAA